MCAELFIHRNTLAYRLKRIRELLGLDLQDGRVRATLLMALRLA
ncbi:helix-turn-helix domain-containing protein [Amycolatopsis sp. NPDC023774]